MNSSCFAVVVDEVGVFGEVAEDGVRVVEGELGLDGCLGGSQKGADVAQAPEFAGAGTCTGGVDGAGVSTVPKPT